MIFPQFVLIVIVLASFLSGALGCFSVAGACAFDFGVEQPGTEVGRSAAEAPESVSEDAAIARAQIAVVIFIVEFLLPLDRSWWL